MSLLTGFRRRGAGLILASVMLASGPALAQEPSAEHLAAARAAISALKATDQFDVILPNAAEQLKASLIQATPDLQGEIDATVDEQALAMVTRRADLEREAASIYAKTFSQEDLRAIAEFYESKAGKALLDNGALVTRELLKAAEIWSNGIARDMADEVAKKLHAKLGDRPRIEEVPGQTPKKK
jgi:Uncharacterized protein conserved in bacteria